LTVANIACKFILTASKLQFFAFRIHGTINPACLFSPLTFELHFYTTVSEQFTAMEEFGGTFNLGLFVNFVSHRQCTVSVHTRVGFTVREPFTKIFVTEVN